MKNEKIDNVIEHIENKYDEKVEIVSYTAKNIDMPYDEIVCKDSNGKMFFVRIKKENGEQVIYDNYYGILKSEDYRKVITDILDDYLPEYKYFFNFTAGHFDNKYDKDFEITDALAENPVQFFSYNHIFITNETAEQLDGNVFENLYADIEKRGLSLYIAAYSYTESEYELIDENEDVNKYLPSDHRVDPIFEENIN